MATKIVTKNSSTASAVPTASDLVQGELAVNVADKRLFTEDNAGAIVELGTNPSGNVTFQDNGKAIFGAGSDLQIYHDGSHSYVGDYGTGNLSVTGNNLYLQNTSGETYLSGISDGAVSLYHNNAAKLATTATGIDVTGNCTMASGGSIVAGGANDLILNAGESGTPDIYLQSGSSTKVKIEGSDGSVGIGNSNPSAFNTLGATDKLVVGDSTVSNLTLFGTNYGSLAFADSNTSGSTAQYAGLIQYYHADNSMQFYTSSTERMRLDSDGATIYNGKELRIKRPNGSGDIRLFNTSTYATIESTVDPIYIKSANAIRFDTNGNDQRMLIDNAGNVGIGTSSPSYTLETSRATSNTIASRSDGTAYVSVAGNNTTPLTSSFDIIQDSANAYVWQRANAPMLFATNNTERLRIDSAGRLGLGVTPEAWSSIFKVLRVGTGSSIAGESGGSSTWFNTNAYYDGSWKRINTNTSAQIAHTSDGKQEFKVAAAGSAGGAISWNTAMTVDNSGNVLVGKTSTDDGVAGLRVSSLGVIVSTIASPSTNTYLMYSGGYKFYVNTNGGISNFSANNVNLSDEREKKNIELLESQWDSLKQWSLKKFHYNADDDSDNKKLGVIAQEVEAHNPEVIDEFNVDDETTRMAVKEQQMMWMAIKALQEAQTRIETLEARVTELENN